MKKSVLIIVMGLCLIGAAYQAQAADTGTISVTVSLESAISVSVAPGTWNLGVVALSSTSTEASFTATIGNTTAKLEIIGADGAGGWTIGATPAEDRFTVAVTSPEITLTKAYQTLAASVPAYDSQGFGLTYSAPTSDTKGGGVSQGFTITVKASAP